MILDSHPPLSSANWVPQHRCATLHPWLSRILGRRWRYSWDIYGYYDLICYVDIICGYDSMDILWILFRYSTDTILDMEKTYPRQVQGVFLNAKSWRERQRKPIKNRNTCYTASSVVDVSRMWLVNYSPALRQWKTRFIDNVLQKTSIYIDTRSSSP